jgi:outer membrane lipoprotein-sorting protein
MKELFRRTAVLGCLILAFSFVQPLHADEKGEKIVQKASKKIESIKQMCADYVQTFYWQLADETNAVGGTVCVRNGVSFRIENRDQQIITDGKTLWTISHVNEQVIIDHAENSTSDNPFLYRYLRDMIKVYEAKLVSEDANQYYLQLTARSEDEFQREVQLYIDKKTDLLKKAVQVDINGNTVTYELTNVNLGVELDNSVFQANYPASYEVIDMR